MKLKINEKAKSLIIPYLLKVVMLSSRWFGYNFNEAELQNCHHLAFAPLSFILGWPAQKKDQAKKGK